MALSAVILVIMTASYFDADEQNNFGLQSLSIPLVTILACQALMDYQFLVFTENKKTRVFYYLDNPYKKFTVYLNCLATLAYGICVFRWMYII